MSPNALTKFFLLVTLTHFLSNIAAQDTIRFREWDLNNDLTIQRSEFTNEFIERYYGDWDLDDNDYLDNNEFYQITFQFWDIDDNGKLEQNEWYRGFDVYYGEYVMKNFSEVDEDDDGFISYEEYFKTLNESRFYVSWDVNEDGVLNKYELARGVFNYWDLDDSSVIEYDEYKEFDNYYLYL